MARSGVFVPMFALLEALAKITHHAHATAAATITETKTAHTSERTLGHATGASSVDKR